MKKKILTSILSIALVASLFIGIIGLFSPDKAIAASGDRLSGKWTATSSIDTTVDKDAGDFSIIAMGDQQIALGNDQAYVEESYKYIAQNKDAMNLKMFINLGDVMDVADFCDFIGGYEPDDPNGRNRGEDDTSKYFWQQQKIVSDWVQILEDAEIPVAMIMGNHDYEDMATYYRIGKTFDQAFPITRFTPYQVTSSTNVSELDGTHYFGGAMYQDIENSYYYFNGNGQKYMVLVLGLHPTMAMIDWANEVVEANSDCKVIVATHAYFKGGTSTYDSSERLWNELLSKHENIIMSMCGHSSDSGNIVKKVNFGDNGNPVYQFMINSQGEEFGGMGVFAQIIFRADGDIDFAYYSPAVETYASQLVTTPTQGKYYGEVNQFTLDSNLKEVTLPTTQEILVGNTYSGEDVYENYAAYSVTNNKWLRNVYAYNNVEIRATKGLVAKDGVGYVTYKLDAGDYNRFKTMELTYLGKMAQSGIISIDLSTDGVNFENAFYNDSIISVLGRKVDINRYVLGARDLYIRVILKGDNNSYISTLDLDGSTVKTVYGMGTDSMSYSLDITDSSKVNNDNVDANFYNTFDTVIQNGAGVLGSGDARDNHSSKSMIEFRFESGNERTFKTLDFSAVMRINELPTSYTFAERNVDYNGTKLTIEGSTHDIKEADSAYALRIWVSTDGVSYSMVKEINNADSFANRENVSINHTFDVVNATEVYVKLEYRGFLWKEVGFKNINFNGTFNGTGDVSADLQLNGGVIYGDNLDNPIKDGYVFDGWHIGSTNGEKVNVSDYINTNVTLVAKWIKLSRITYILDNGINHEDNVSILAEGEVITLSNPVREGYRFIGWYNADAEKVTSVTADGSNIVLYAIWYKL